jgi:rare lipoprotein A
MHGTGTTSSAGKQFNRGAFAVAAVGVAMALSGCGENGLGFSLGARDPGQPVSATPATALASEAEAPEVFSLTAQGLWDGRPSLGGVWVAAPGVTDPERVVIRHAESGEEVIGALFRRERENPGPPIQVSSDAAAALGLLAGQPARLAVVALRRVDPPPTAAEVPPKRSRMPRSHLPLPQRAARCCKSRR